MYKELRTNHELFKYLHKPGHDRTKPMILFNHGFRVPPHYYDPVLDLLNAEGHEVIALDRYNTDPRPQTAQQNLYHTALFIHALCPDNHYVNLGHSLGGFISLKLQPYHIDADAYIATNPAVPVKYGIKGFVKAGLGIGVNDLKDTVNKHKLNPIKLGKYLTALANLDGKVMKNIILSPCSTIGVMDSIKDISYRDVMFTDKHRVFQSTRDEFFPLDVVYDTLPATYITQMEGTHSYPLHNPQDMTQMILQYLNRTTDKLPITTNLVDNSIQ